MRQDVFTIDLKQSIWLLRYLVVLHGFFFITVLFLPLDWFWRGGLGLLLIASLCFYYQSYFRITGRYKVIKLACLNDIWAVFYGDGHSLQGQILKQTVVIEQIVILHFKTDRFWSIQSVCVVADETDLESMRQLRVLCRDPKTFRQ